MDYIEFVGQSFTSDAEMEKLSRNEREKRGSRCLYSDYFLSVSDGLFTFARTIITTRGITGIPGSQRVGWGSDYLRP